MSGKISLDPDKAVDGSEKVAASAGGSNYGILISSIATYLASLTQALTSKTINAASNTISNLTTAMFAASVIDTDGTLAANSDTRLASQKAVKTYADALIGANDAMVFKGVIDCSTSPNYPAANRGHTYKVSVAGKIGGASGVNVEIADTLICITDGSAAGTQAAVGANWTVIQANIDGAVIGPASSTSGNIPTFNGTGGKTLQDSGIAASTIDAKFGSVKIRTFNADGTYTPTPGMISCVIECIGGGGGGGSVAGSAAPSSFSGGGGGAGSYSRLVASAATIGASKAVTIGAGGSGGAAGSNNGTAGGDTSVGTLCIGKGGQGGLFGSVSQVGTGGAGGVSGTGDLTGRGNQGGSGIYVNSVTGSLVLATNNGGHTVWNSGAPAPTPVGGAAVAGVAAAANSGGGGSGGVSVNVAANAAGGNGGTGQVVITEFLKS